MLTSADSLVRSVLAAQRRGDASLALGVGFDGLLAASARAMGEEVPPPHAVGPAAARDLVVWDIREPVLPSDEQIMADMNIGAISNSEREQKAIEQFQRAGATAGPPIVVEEGQAPPLDRFDTVIVQDAGGGKRNVYVVKKGRTDRIVIVGGHLDRVGGGSHGIIDNWSGSRKVMYLYGLMRGVETEATIVFINFAREEEGLLGSKRWLHAHPSSQWSKFDVMFNEDTHGIKGLFTLKNGSSRKQLDLAMSVARQIGLDLKEEPVHGGDSDHTTFRRVGIPILMAYGVPPDVIFDHIHSEKDNITPFNLVDYKAGLRFSFAYLQKVAQEPQREIIVIGSDVPDFVKSKPVAAAAAAYATVPRLVAGGDYAGLHVVLAKIEKAIAWTRHRILRRQLARARESIEEMLEANTRARGSVLVARARASAEAGRRAQAARQYRQAAAFYRAAGLPKDAAVFLRLAAAQLAARGPRDP